MYTYIIFHILTQTHKGEHHINKIKIFNIMIQNKLQGAKAQKQGKQETPHRTPLVTHILDRPIRSRAEAPASNTSQHAQRCPMHQIYILYTEFPYTVNICPPQAKPRFSRNCPGISLHARCLHCRCRHAPNLSIQRQETSSLCSIVVVLHCSRCCIIIVLAREHVKQGCADK
jgi:hypothetical protein